MDLAIVGGDDRFTDRQSDAHAALVSAAEDGAEGAASKILFSRSVQFHSMIPDMTLDLGIVSGEITLKQAVRFWHGNKHFPEIDDDLLDQQWIMGTT